MPTFSVLVLVATIGLWRFSKSNASRKTQTASHSVEPSESLSISPSIAENACDVPISSANTWTLYTNATFGFQLSLDSAWEGYTTATSSVLGAPHAERINFELPSSSITPAAVAFRLDIVPVSDWRYFLPIGSPSDYSFVPTFIGSSAQYIFGYYFTDSPPPEILADYRCEIARVLNTFRFISR